MSQTPKNKNLIAALALGIAAFCVQPALAAEEAPTVQDRSGHVEADKKMPQKADAKIVAPSTATEVDHSKMNHGDAAGADMAGMDHGDMSMQGGPAPADARDPHAYSGGYDFGMKPRMKMADETLMGGIMVNRLERAKTGSNVISVYDLQAAVGKDYDKLVLKAEGEVEEGKLHEARTELLWSHAVDAYWDAQLGVRQDSGVRPGRSWLAFGVQGLAPYWFELDATVYAGEEGRTALRLGAEYELLITQRLVLQPRLEANIYGKEDAARELGSGLSSLVAGLRLRYEIRREFAPYIGVDWSSKYGGTADYASAAGAETKDTLVVAGLRMWY